MKVIVTIILYAKLCCPPLPLTDLLLSCEARPLLVVGLTVVDTDLLGLVWWRAVNIEIDGYSREMRYPSYF